MEYLEPSPVGAMLDKHLAAMAPCRDQPEGKSFAVPFEGYIYECLRDIADGYNVGKRAYVVIQHARGYEVQRLPDGSNVALFYRYAEVQTQREYVAAQADAVEILRSGIKAYDEGDSLLDYVKYDAKLSDEMKANRVFSYALMQRKFASVSVFKNSSYGATIELKKAFDALVEEEYISEVPKEEASTKYDTFAKLYRIL